MALVQRFDSGRLSKATRTGSGGARVPASIARTGIQTYTDAQGRTVREYRAPDVVFDAAALETLASIPVTVGHPGAVDAANWRRHAVGHVSDAPPARRADARVPGREWLDAQIIIQDADALRRIEAGDLVEVSMGYLADVVYTPGVTPSGEHYDAIQHSVRFNHLALLPSGRARAGAGARLRLDGNQMHEDFGVDVSTYAGNDGSVSHTLYAKGVPSSEVEARLKRSEQMLKSPTALNLEWNNAAIFKGMR
jgi:hypothetical protein